MESELPDWALEMAVELVDSDQFKGLMAVDRIGKCSEMVARTLVSASQRETANLISIIADIREKSGVGTRPMLGDLAFAISEEMSRRERRGRREAIEEAAKIHDDEADRLDAAAIEEMSVAAKIRLDGNAALHRHYAAAIRQIEGAG